MNLLFWKRKKAEPEQRSNSYLESACYALGLSNATLNLANYPAMSLSPVYSAVQIISNAIASLPIDVCIKQDNRKQKLDNHTVYHLFDNTLMTRYTTMKTMMCDLLLIGNAYAYIKRDETGKPIELRYVRPSDVQIEFNEAKQQLYYKIPTVRRGAIEPIDMIHLTINSLEGVYGRGILFFADKTVKLAKNADKASSNFFSSGCAVNGILSSDAMRLTDEQRNKIRQSWTSAQTGDGSGIAVLEAGMKYSPVASSMQDAQMIETRLFNVNEIARFFNISPILLGDLSHSQYGTIESANIEFVQHTLLPYVEMIECEFTRKLILPVEHNIYINFNTNVLLKADKQTEANYITTLTKNGIITINEARQMLSLNPIDGCDDLILPYTDVASNKVNETDTDKDEDNDKNNDEENGEGDKKLQDESGAEK